MFSILTSSQLCTEGPGYCKREEKEIKAMNIGKEEIKLTIPDYLLIDIVNSRVYIQTIRNNKLI